MSFDWIGFAGMIVTLTVGFTVGVVSNLLFIWVVPFGLQIIKLLHYGVFALILIGTLGLPLMFIPLAPFTGLLLLVAFVAMNGYVLYYIFDQLF